MKVEEVKPISPTGRLTQGHRPTIQNLLIGKPAAAWISAWYWSQGKSWLTHGLYDALLLETRQRYLAGQREIIAAAKAYIQSLRRP